MNTLITKLGSLAVVLMLVVACGGESTDVVESGTYEGTIQEVNPDESEIYVNTPDDKTLELYFIESTELVKNNQPVPFDSLANGQKVRVEVEKVGQRLDPLRVEILE
ncbi:hypothetical protein [Fodinibius sediminis]|uniref:DUF5666 domain-containing protein n=1 Tax=Fodinibius sediminis TaxID=1214077 RepID=A0A521AKT7_9BACT|nr:hypothetical protein [Fodinibius sediminis]SMO35391.1 hypothetical protein SAMN06265218_101183 [Fodinibius sediminis]